MYREDFPIINDNLIFLDNASTTLKSKYVIEKINNYYEKFTSNVHRGDYNNSIITNKLYEESREIIKQFLNAKNADIIFTQGTTMSINQVVFGYMKYNLKKEDEVILSKSEHASNILPWIILEEEIGIKIKYVKLNKDLEIDINNLKEIITEKTKVISLAHITNVIGDLRDIEKIGKICKEKNILFNVDGAQSVPHIKVDFGNSNIDFLSFSSHKLTGPTGVGCLVLKKELSEKMNPIIYGGGMNQDFEDHSYILKSSPVKFEAGTPPIAQVLGMTEAIKYLDKIGMDKIEEYELKLKKYLVEKLEEIDNITIYNKNSKSGIISFNINNVFAQDVSVYLNKYNIAVRAGNHCCKRLKEEIGISNTVRISLYFYNTYKEIDTLIEVLKNSKNIYNEIL